MFKEQRRRKSSPASEISWPETVTTGIFVKQVVFLTMNHRGPLPLRELHSTDETIVWRDPRGSEPVYGLFTITSDFSLPEAVCDTDM